MQPDLRPRAAVVLAVLLALVLTGVSGAAAGSPTADRALARADAEAQRTAGDPAVGPLFPHGASGGHSCTASVLDLPGNLVLTAAHCLTGTAQGMQFVPGYDGTLAAPDPFGVWDVTALWVPAAWTDHQDQDSDVALLRVRRTDDPGADLRSITPGLDLGLPDQADADTTVTVPAYAAGIGDAPLTCTATTFTDQAALGFRCGGYVSGTSGAPWLVPTERPGVSRVVGIIGGLHQGGCSDDTSYSPPLDVDVFGLFLQDLFGWNTDTAPTPPDSGC